MSKILCYDSYGRELKYFYQWDINQTITIKGVTPSMIKEVHFCTCGDEMALVMTASVFDDYITVDVPNVLLQQGSPVFMYLYQASEESGKTVHLIQIPVKKRAKPENYVYTESEILNYSTLDARVTALEKVAEAVEPPVKSVNGQKGNVELNAEDVGALPADTQIPTVPTNVSAFSNDAGYATEKQVTQAVAAVADTIPDVPTNVSAFNNDAGYQTAAQVDATARARASEVEAKIPTVPTNVSAFTNDANYQSGEKVTQAIQAASDLLTIEINKKAADGHTHDDRYYTETETDALLKKKQDSISHYVATVNGQSGDVSVTVGSIGAEAAGTAAAQVTAHNTDGGAHNDIRLLLQQLTERVNTVLDSDDTTLDQMSEIVAYIKEHSDLLDAVTTQKISYSDIVDNLTTNLSSKPLSAAQGVALKALIDAIVIPTKVSELTNDANYQNADQVSETASAAAEAAAAEVEAKIPTVPTNVSAFTNDAGYATETQVTQAAAAVEAKIPTVPSNVSVFTNDAGYQTGAQVSATANAAAAAVEAMIPTVPSNVSVFTNDAGYQTGAQVSATASAAAAKVDNTFIFETVVSLSASGLSVSLPEGVTHASLIEQINAGKTVILSAEIPAVAGILAGKYNIPFTRFDGDRIVFSTTAQKIVLYVFVDDDNSVGFNYYFIEQQSNKVTSLSASSTDTQYPSAKAVYDALGGLKIAVSDTVPTVDDRSILTLVIEG